LRFYQIALFLLLFNSVFNIFIQTGRFGDFSTTVDDSWQTEVKDMLNKNITTEVVDTQTDITADLLNFLTPKAVKDSVKMLRKAVGTPAWILNQFGFPSSIIDMIDAVTIFIFLFGIIDFIRGTGGTT